MARPFQAARTLSSVAGWALASRASNSRGSAAATWAASSSPAGLGVHRTLVPSQLPSGVAPRWRATGSPAIETSSSNDQTKNRPSTPSESASWEEKNPPSPWRSSRSR